MVELDVDVSVLSVQEQRMLAGLVPLLDPARDGILRVHDKAISGAWRLQPNATLNSALDLIAPSGTVRAQLSRPIVLGALKRMLQELAGASGPRLVPTKLSVPTHSAHSNALSTPGPTRISRPIMGPAKSPTLASAEHKTDPRAFVGIPDLGKLLEALMQPGEGLFDLRFGNGASIRIDRGANNFRCRGFPRAELWQRLNQPGARWAQLVEKTRAKSDETQASMSPLLFALGALTSKERFIAGTHTELEFQIRTPVAYARIANLQGIAEVFAEFSPVADAALKLSMAPVEVLACLNGYAAIGMLRSRPRSLPPVPAPEEKPGGLFSRIKSRFV
jgi:hypothetical protein